MAKAIADIHEAKAVLERVEDLARAMTTLRMASEHLCSAISLAADGASPTVELKMAAIGLGSALATVNKYLPEQSP